jgi:hypothetical protein
MLAILLRTDTAFPFTFVGGTGLSLQVRDPNGTVVQIDLSGETRLPVRLTYEERERAFSGEFTGNVFRKRIEMSDHAKTGTFMLPRTIVVFRDDVEIQRRRIDTIEINPSLSAADCRHE